MPEVVAAGPVVHEADDVVAQLAVLEILSATRRPSSPAPAMRIRFSPMPARHRRSSASRTSSRDANVNSTLKARKNAQTICDTSYAPRSFSSSGT